MLITIYNIYVESVVFVQLLFFYGAADGVQHLFDEFVLGFAQTFGLLCQGGQAIRAALCYGGQKFLLLAQELGMVFQVLQSQKQVGADGANFFLPYDAVQGLLQRGNTTSPRVAIPTTLGRRW